MLNIFNYGTKRNFITYKFSVVSAIKADFALKLQIKPFIWQQWIFNKSEIPFEERMFMSLSVFKEKVLSWIRIKIIVCITDHLSDWHSKKIVLSFKKIMYVSRMISFCNSRWCMSVKQLLVYLVLFRIKVEAMSYESWSKIWKKITKILNVHQYSR